MNLFFGSVLATISLTVPVVTLIAFLTGQRTALWPWRAGNGRDGRLAAAVPDIVLYRRTNVLNGAAHLALFAAYLMTIFA